MRTLVELWPTLAGMALVTYAIRVGGLVIAQALLAAYETVEDRVCHSLHAYFIRPGDVNIPVLYEVDRSRDGGTFTTRRVTAIQNGKQIFNLAASFQEAVCDVLSAKAIYACQVTGATDLLIGGGVAAASCAEYIDEPRSQVSGTVTARGVPLRG